MGEHIKVDGQAFKLGTCEDLYYVRYETLREWVQAGRVQEGIEELYLRPDVYRFRFPFPDEDHAVTLPPLEMAQAFWQRGFERGETVTAPAAVMEGLDDHARIRVPIDSSPTGPGFNLAVPCPYSAGWADVIAGGAHASPIPQNLVHICQQKPVQVDGGGLELWTVIRCGFCRAKVRLPRDQAAALAEAVGGEMGRRIMAGYDAKGEK